MAGSPPVAVASAQNKHSTLTGTQTERTKASSININHRAAHSRPRKNEIQKIKGQLGIDYEDFDKKHGQYNMSPIKASKLAQSIEVPQT